MDFSDRVYRMSDDLDSLGGLAMTLLEGIRETGWISFEFVNSDDRVDITRSDVGVFELRIVDRDIANETFVAEERTSFGGIPVSDAAIRKLEALKYGDVDQFREKDCAICLNEFDKGEDLTKMHCSHSFHYACLAQWLERSRTCPLCRYELC